MSGQDSPAPPVEEFEARLEQLQKAVQRLEEEDLTLAEAIAAYQEAVELASACSSMLDAAELRIRTIDVASRELREEAVAYRVDDNRYARLLLGDDDDLDDLLDDEDE